MSEYMRGVAVDCTNKPPGYRKILNVGMNSVRIEMRDLPSFYEYTELLAKHHVQQAWLVGPLTGDTQAILNKVTTRPGLVIIGNEPDIVGTSSWTMPPSQYIALYNWIAPLVRTRWPDIELATAGMYTPDYLRAIYSELYIKPTYVNRHYPDGQYDIKRFDQIGSKTIVGEWTWRDATPKEMNDWEKMLEYYTWASFWFCWADYMVPGHGLIRASGSFTNAYYYLRKVLKGK